MMMMLEGSKLVEMSEKVWQPNYTVIFYTCRVYMSLVELIAVTGCASALIVTWE
jgi:hypothetical protein